jgi:hypothetical protein
MKKTAAGEAAAVAATAEAEKTAAVAATAAAKAKKHAAETEKAAVAEGRMGALMADELQTTSGNASDKKTALDKKTAEECVDNALAIQRVQENVVRYARRI